MISCFGLSVNTEMHRKYAVISHILYYREITLRLFTEETVMAKLIDEYTDRKNIRHTVKHCTLPGGDPASREQILEEIRNILVKKATKNGEE